MNHKKGFTLVEVLAVIAIVAILGVAATAGVSTILQKQKQKLAYQAEEGINQASLTYFGNKGVNYIKNCTNNSNEYITITTKNVEDVNQFLRETKFNMYKDTALYNEIKNYSVVTNNDPSTKYELDPYIKVSDRACYKLVTVGELIEQGLITDADGMCNKASLAVVYRKADAKNTAGVITSVQETGICKSTRKTESGPVITISPPSSLSLSSSKSITVTVTTESTKLKPSFKMYYGWSNDKMIKPTSWSELSFSGNTDAKGSAEINVNTIDETRYLWIQKGTSLDNKNNKTSEMIAGPYAFLPSVFVRYNVNTGDSSSCPNKKEVVFTKEYNKNKEDVTEDLCEPEKTGYDFAGWYREGTMKVENSTKVDIKIDHELAAKWTPHIYTINLDKNGATNTPTSSIKIAFDSKTLNPTSITLPVKSYKVSGFGLDATRKSNGATVSSVSDLTSTYTFNGWTTTKDGSVFLLSNAATPALKANVTGYTNAEGIWKKTEDTTAYAKWTSAAVKLPTITKTGYDCGWTTASSGTTITYNSGINYTPTANVTMYGVCQPHTYKIVFHKNNGSATGSTATKNCKFDENCKLTKNGFSLSGHTFKGWNTAANGSGTNYTDEKTVKNLTSVNNGTINLYAQWNAACTSNNYSGCKYVTSCRMGAVALYNSLSNALRSNPQIGFVCNSYSGIGNDSCGPIRSFTKLYVVDSSHANDRGSWGAVKVCFREGEGGQECYRNGNNDNLCLPGKDSSHKCAWIQTNCLTQYYDPGATIADFACKSICKDDD